MHKVVTINLNGRAFQLDDDAFEALRAYLDLADAQLKVNPDRVEILADLEQAIADKADRYLVPPKTVLSLGEVHDILREMGPVEGGTGAADDAGDRPRATPPPAGSTPPNSDGSAPRRLYRIMEGSMLGGVCTGLSAFTQIDVNVVRAIVLVLAIVELTTIHSGLILLLYFALMFILPEASTQEERAAARGVPFNAQEVVENAKRFGRRLNQDWRREERAWRRKRRWERREWKRGFAQPWWGAPPMPPVPPVGYGSRVLAGLTLPVLTVVSALMFWGGGYLVLSMIRAGDPETWRIHLGLPFSLPATMPLWVGVLILIFAWNALTLPLRMARKASYYAIGGPYHGWFEAWDGLLSIGISAAVLWWAYHAVPEVRDMLQHLPDMWETLKNSFRR